MNPASFYKSDPWLNPFREIIDKRADKYLAKEKQLTGKGSLVEFAMGHYYYGLHLTDGQWVMREWAPNATSIYLIGTFNGWKHKKEFLMKRINSHGDWEITLPFGTLKHEDLFKLLISWEGGKGERIPSYATRVIQDDKTKIFSAQVWHPEEQYIWEVPTFNAKKTAPVIYEAHIGMATS